MAESLNQIEQQVYHYLIDYLTEHTYQPSVREIGRKFQLASTKTVSDVLEALARKGYIERDASRSRGVRLIGYSGVTRTQPVPVYGRIHAGEPALLPEHRTGYLTIDRRFIPNERVFCLRVAGDSMAGRCILDGDYVLIDPSAPSSEGAIVAARIGADAAIKTLQHRGGTIVLQSTHPEQSDILLRPGDDFAVLGVVCGVFRSLHDNGAAPTDVRH